MAVAEQRLGFELKYLSCCCRLFDLVAEDNAIVDTIYYLSRALNSEVIDLATFMKVRKERASFISSCTSSWR